MALKVLTAAPGTMGREVVKKREPKTQGASAGPSQRGSDGAQGKESKEEEVWAAHSGCASSALGSSSPKGTQ